MIRYYSAKHESNCRRMRALTLAELLVCLGMMSVVLGVGGLCFAQVVRLRTAQERYNARLDATDYLFRRVAKADLRECGRIEFPVLQWRRMAGSMGS